MQLHELISAIHRHQQCVTIVINTDASKHEKEQIGRVVQEMFEEADMWLDV
ncbi:DinI-like family protein [Enterobacter soli]